MFVVLYVTCKFVCLNRLVIVHMSGLKYVKVLIFVGCDVVVVVWFVVVMLDLLIYSMKVLYGESIIFRYCWFLFFIWV